MRCHRFSKLFHKTSKTKEKLFHVIRFVLNCKYFVYYIILAETVNELEEMIQSQKQLMDKLTNECKTLTNKLEDTTIKHK